MSEATLAECIASEEERSAVAAALMLGGRGFRVRFRDLILAFLEITPDTAGERRMTIHASRGDVEAYFSGSRPPAEIIDELRRAAGIHGSMSRWEGCSFAQAVQVYVYATKRGLLIEGEGGEW